jgi:hypothetical protein
MTLEKKLRRASAQMKQNNTERHYNLSVNTRGEEHKRKRLGTALQHWNEGQCSVK